MNFFVSFLIRLLFLALLLAFSAYVGIFVMIFLRQRSMVFHPHVLTEFQMLENAEQVGMARWQGPDGTLHGWMTRDGTESDPVLIFHGNTGHALDRLGVVAHLREGGAMGRIYIADYPGYGSRPGSPTQRSLTDAGLAALDALPGQVVVVGESLGTGVAAQLAARRPNKFRSLLLITPFDSMVAAAAHHYPWLPVRLLLLDRFDSVAALASFREPVVILLGKADDTTPPEGARRLHSSLSGPSKLLEVEGAGHNDAMDELTPAAWREAWKFLTQTVRTGPSRKS